MNHMFSIGDIARLLNVPTATLRFWEEKGLFTVEKGKNRYRRYNVRNLAEIADVIFFRNLGIPVSRVGALGSSTLEEYACHLQDTQDQLKEKIHTYSQMYGRTEQQLLHLQEVRALMQCTFQLEEVPFCAVYAFDYGEKDKLLRYTQDPSCYVRYFDTRDMSTEMRGIIMPPDQASGSLLWEKSSDSRFVTFLIREKVDQNYESDVTQTLAYLQRRYHTGHLLARYLLSAEEDGVRMDYLKAYLEIWPRE